MKITLEQLKRLIRETVEESVFMASDDPENTNNPLNHPHSRDLLKGISPEELEDRSRQGASVEQGFSNPKPSRHDQKSLSDRDFLPENRIRMVYTNHGVLMEERVRELREYGYEMEECGSWEVEGPSMRVSDRYMGDEMEEPVAKVLVVRGSGLEEGEHQDDKYGDRNKYSPGYGSMEESSLTEGETSSPADGGSVTGTQVGNVGPQGIPGSAASGNPGGANVPNSSEPKTKKEAFNHRAERILEAWMEEELHGDQDKLDINKNNKLDKFDFMALRNKKKKAKKEA